MDWIFASVHDTREQKHIGKVAQTTRRVGNICMQWIKQHAPITVDWLVTQASKVMARTGNESTPKNRY